jgi:signal transduction histidine kinase
MTERQHLKRIGLFALVAALGWTALMAGFACWHAVDTRSATSRIATAEARMALEKDLLYRHWVASHGGVYVPVSSTTPPNPNLKHLPERDITTPSGRRLTLMNPAYMTRQVFEYSKLTRNTRGHITSLHPMHPDNMPDLWEEQALKRFKESGVKEVSSRELIDGKSYLRLIIPFKVEQHCLKCHAEEGYKTGDLRGGISVSVPLADLEAGGKEQNTKVWIAVALIWMLGLLVIAWGRKRLVIGRTAMEEVNRLLTVRVEEELAKSRAKDAMLLRQARYGLMGEVLVNISHQWRQPLNNIGILVQEIAHSNRSGMVSQEFVDHSVRHVMDLLKGLSKTIDNFTNFYHPNQETRLIKPSQMIIRAMEMVREAFEERGISITIDLVSEGQIECRPDDLAQSILNILNNARDAIVSRKIEPGRIDIRVEKTGEEEGAKTRITIADNGGGVPEELLQRIFDPYVTSKFQAQGVGLGLYIVKQTIEGELGGTVTFSNSAQGAEFVIEL